MVGRIGGITKKPAPKINKLNPGSGTPPRPTPSAAQSSTMVRTGTGGAPLKGRPISGNQIVPSAERYLRTPSKGEKELKVKREELNNSVLRNLNRKVSNQPRMFEGVSAKGIGKFAGLWMADWGRNKKRDSNALRHMFANTSSNFSKLSQSRFSNFYEELDIQATIDALKDYGVTINPDDKWTDKELNTIYDSVIKMADKFNQSLSGSYYGQLDLRDPTWLFRSMMGDVTIVRDEGLIDTDCTGDKVNYAGLTCGEDAMGSPKTIYLGSDALGDEFPSNVTKGTFSGEQLIMHEFGHVLQKNWNLRGEQLSTAYSNSSQVTWPDDNGFSRFFPGYKLTDFGVPEGARSGTEPYEYFSDAFMIWITDDFDYADDPVNAAKRKEQLDEMMSKLFIDKVGVELEKRHLIN